MSWQDLLHHEFLGNDLVDWVLAALTFLVTLTVLPLLKRVISLRRWRPAVEDRDRPQFHGAIELATLLVARTSRVFLWAVALYLGSRDLTFTPHLERALTVT